jgi:hypothetical protein
LNGKRFEGDEGGGEVVVAEAEGEVAEEEWGAAEMEVGDEEGDGGGGRHEGIIREWGMESFECWLISKLRMSTFFRTF